MFKRPLGTFMSFFLGGGRLTLKIAFLTEYLVEGAQFGRLLLKSTMFGDRRTWHVTRRRSQSLPFRGLSRFTTERKMSFGDPWPLRAVPSLPEDATDRGMACPWHDLLTVIFSRVAIMFLLPL